MFYYNSKPFSKGDVGAPLLQCTPKCTSESCKHPNCTSAVVLGVAVFTQNDNDDCIPPKLEKPIWPWVLNSNNVFDRERKVGAYYTDVRLYVDWIKSAKGMGMNNICSVIRF